MKSHIKIDDGTFHRVEEVKYLEKNLTNQNSIQKEIIRRLMSGNSCYYSVQNLFSSRFPSTNIKIKKYRTIITPVFCGFETWSLILRGEHWLRVLQDRVLRRKFGPKRDEIKREWRKLHNEEHNDRESSPYTVRVIKSRRTRWAKQVARMGERRYPYRLLVGKPEGKNTQA
jgi:hypothetical protein